VGALSLGADQDEQLGGGVGGVGEGVRGVGVELGDLAGGEDVLVVPEQQAQPAVEDVHPLVALVAALLGLTVYFQHTAPDPTDEQVEQLAALGVEYVAR